MVIDPTSWPSLLAGFATLGKLLMDLLANLREQKHQKYNEAGGYFQDLSDAMSRVVEGLRASRIPRIDGHRMQELIHAFPEKTRQISLGHEPGRLQAALRQVADIAVTLDGWLLMNVPHEESDREHMLEVVERIAGTCAGIADELKKPK